MSIFDEPKADCHNHVFDPARFGYSPTARYLPAGPEVGTRAQLTAVFEAYGVQRALVVQPNSGYDDDNRCLIDALARALASASRPMPASVPAAPFTNLAKSSKILLSDCMASRGEPLRHRDSAARPAGAFWDKNPAARGEKLRAKGRVLQDGRTNSVGAADIYTVSDGTENLCGTVLATTRNFKVK